MTIITAKSKEELIKEAETNLILCLFEHCYIKTPEIQTEILNYPAEKNIERPKLIRRILKYTWPKSIIGSPPFDSFLEFERFMIALNKRDHFIHQFEVFLLGLNVIEVLMVKIKPKKTVFFFDGEWEIILTWLITAMSHDIGYPYEVAKDILVKLEGLYKDYGFPIPDLLGITKNIPCMDDVYYNIEQTSQTVPEIEDSLPGWRRRIIKLFRGNKTCRPVRITERVKESLRNFIDLNEEELSKFHMEMVEKNSHGFVSAIILFNAIIKEYFREFKSRTWENFRSGIEYNMLHLAIGAIATHDTKNKEIIKKIKFDSNPYAYLLFILDNLQDWNREFIPDDNWPRYDLTLFRRDDAKSLIEMQYTLYDPKWLSPMIEKVEQSLSNKEELIGIMNEIDPRLYTTIKIQYKSESDMPGLSPINKEIIVNL